MAFSLSQIATPQTIVGVPVQDVAATVGSFVPTIDIQANSIYGAIIENRAELAADIQAIEDMPDLTVLFQNALS